MPMRYVHRVMREGKARLHASEAAKLAMAVADLRRQLSEETCANRIAELRSRQAELNQHFLIIEQMPTWPATLSVRQVFGANNHILFVTPIVMDYFVNKKGGKWTVFDALLDLIGQMQGS